MDDKKAKKIFEQYNRASDVVRCPSGRARVRKILDSYARAAVNLYGVISRDEFVTIFNKQNSDQTSKEEIYILLLPLVLKEGWYCFYKEFIVHYAFFEDFDQVEYLLQDQTGKPRYVPEKDEFLKYIDEDYVDSDQLLQLRRFMLDVFGISGKTFNAYQDIKDFIMFSDGIKGLGDILDMYHCIFNGKEQLREFLDLVMQAKNNLRIWENNGYTPEEMFELSSKRNEPPEQVRVVQAPIIGRNDLCPCGSGKKYKKCCAMYEDARTAQLSEDEYRLFREIWYGLLDFVNARRNVVDAKILLKNPDDPENIFPLREALWKEPELIDEYIRATELSQETIDILQLWRTKHKIGTFFILKYLPDYVVALGPNDQGEDRLYGIKGLSKPIAVVLQQKLPAVVETVLLPFKGKIIYDSFLSPMSIGFAEGARALLQQMYDKAIKHGIIAEL